MMRGGKIFAGKVERLEVGVPENGPRFGAGWARSKLATFPSSAPSVRLTRQDRGIQEVVPHLLRQTSCCCLFIFRCSDVL